MCGRYVLLRPDLRELMKKLRLDELYNLSVTSESRYNIAPSQSVPVVRQVRAAAPEFTMLSWGWQIPSSEAPGRSVFLLNARAETLPQRSAFKSNFQERRCVLPASGFYEWRRVTKPAQPHFIQLENGEPFFLAGLWQVVEGKGAACVVVTTQANALMQPIHDRMPVLLTTEGAHAWLDQSSDQVNTLDPLLKPFPPERMQVRPVSDFVNSATHEGEACLRPPTIPPPPASEQLGFGF